jgi:hypothetical protein
LKRFGLALHYPKIGYLNPSEESFMSIDVADGTPNEFTTRKRGSVGSWEMHSWGDARFPGMAAVSAITTLQIGATLTPSAEDKAALGRAVEYLMEVLAPQLKSFQHAQHAD